MVFTEGSSKGTAIVVSYPIIKTARNAAASGQIAKLLALAMALQLFIREALTSILIINI